MTALVTGAGLRIAGRLSETSLALSGGELTCLVGPNGSGKTSLLHALAGIGRPQGDVLIAGLDPKSLPPPTRRRCLAYLPASREAHWPLSVADLVALGLPGGSRDERVETILHELGLTRLAARRVDRLSTGEQSRALIARALVGQPQLLLLDEPVANLDPLWQLRLMEHLRALARDRDRALLVAMHDLDMAARYADRLIIMKDGAIAADGDPRALLASPAVPAIFGIEAVGGAWRPVG